MTDLIVRMTNYKLEDFIRKHVALSAEEMAFVTASFEPRKFPKGHPITRQGEVEDSFNLISSGCARYYRYDNKGAELNVWFAFPGYICCDIQGFISGIPSKFNIETLSKVECFSISKTDFYNLSDQVAAWDKFQISIWGEAVVHMIDRVIEFQYLSAEERYKNIIEHPYYTQLLSQKDLASFLGITKTSLSRLRRQMKPTKKLP